MKKAFPFIAILIALLLTFSSCAGCSQNDTEPTTVAPTEATTVEPSEENPPETEPTKPSEEPGVEIDQEFVDKAADMIYEFYKPGKSNTVSADFTLPSKVKYQGVDVEIQWFVESGSEFAEIGESEYENLINVLVNKSSSGGPFKLKGVVKAGNYTKEIEFDYELVSQYDLLTAAYALQPNENIENSTLTGVISKVNTPYDPSYGNITVTIIVDGHDDMPIMCYRLKGDGVDTIKVGDTITVFGTLTNYNGTIEFTTGCTLVSIDNVGEEIPDDSPVFDSDREIVNAAYALPGGDYLSQTKTYTLTGKVTKINTPYDDGYKNVTVTIVVDGMTDKPIQCYRMKGDDAAKVKVTDVIQVTGYLKNYVSSSGNSTIEFDAGCTLDKIVEVGPGEAKINYGTDQQIVDAAYALAAGDNLVGEQTLTGKVTKVNTPYDPNYQNVTVTIVVEGREDKPIQCFRMKGDLANVVKVTDVIKVTGILKNYVSASGTSTIEFDAGCHLDAIVTSGAGENAPSFSSQEQIVNALYALGEDEYLATTKEYTLTGKITKINTAYDEGYGNISVTIVVGNLTDKPVQCYRMKGADDNMQALLSKLKVTDTITVTGLLKDYHGTKEFDAGCKMTSYKAGDGKINEPTYGTTEEILNALYALGENEMLSPSGTQQYSLTGKITKINTPYDGGYGNISVTIVVPGYEDKPVQAYRMKGADDNMTALLPKLKYSDTITVKGYLKDYNGTKEFDAGCLMTSYKAGSETPPAVEIYTTPEEIINALYELPNGDMLSDGYEYTLKGKITKVNTPFDEQYGNVTVTIVVNGMEDKPIMCYRLKGADDNMTALLPKLKYSDTITVKGRLKNYNGTKEFDAGCLMTKYKEGNEEAPEVPIYETTEEILNALYELKDGEFLSDGYTYSLKGKITEINTEYSEQYGNITVTMIVDGFADKPVMCYRLKATDEAMLKVLPTLKVTDVITVEGKLKNYQGTREFDAGCLLTKYKAGTGELSDAEKLAIEKAALELTPTTFKKATEVTLPKAKTYTDVKITWKSNSDYAKVSSGKLVITLPEKEDATATVTATLTLGTEKTTKKFTLTIKAPSSEPEKVYTVDEMLALMKDYTNNQTSEEEYTIRGLVTSSTYKSNYKSYDIWLASDDGKTAQAFQLYSVALDTSITEDYTAADALAGKYVTCTGYVKLYGTTYEMPYLKSAPDGSEYTPTVTKVEDAELSDAEKVAFEKGKLTVSPTTFSKETTVTLPKAKTYTDVAITWKSNSEYAVVKSGKLTITLPTDADVTATLTATLKLNDAKATKKFTLTIKKASTEPEKVYTVDEILEVMKDYADKQVSDVEYTVKGIATSSSYNSNYKSYTIWLQSDDGSEAKAFELYSVNLDGSITADYTATDALKGKTVTCVGYIQLYGTTKEMPFLRAASSPTGADYTPTVTAVEETELTDAQKVAAEKADLTLSQTTFTKETTLTLPTAKTYTDVKITWKSDSEYATIKSGKLIITLPESEDVTATVTATLTLNDAKATKKFTLTIKSQATPPEKVYTVDEILALMANYEDNQTSTEEYTVQGIATSSTYKSNYSSYDIWLQSDDGSNAKAFEFYSVGLDASINGDYTAKDAMAGKLVTCKGYVKKYVTSSGTTYEMPYLGAGSSPTGAAYTPMVTEISTPDLTDQEKVDFEQGKLELTPTTFTEATELTLPAATSYTEVAITWKSDSDYAKVSGDKLVITLPDNEDATANVTATLKLNSASATKKFTLTIKMAGQEEKVYTVDEILELMKDYTDNQTSEEEYTVQGVVTGSTYKSNYKSYDIWLASDDGKTEQAFQLYSVALDSSITEDYTAADALKGKKVTCKGYIKKFVKNSEVTYEMPYLGASSSPTGAAYTPTVKKVENDVYTVDEILEVMKDYADNQTSEEEYKVKGVVTSSSYNSNYKSYTIWLASDDGETKQAFELYSVGMGEEVTEDFSAADALKGKIVTCKGYIKKFVKNSEVTYEMPYLGASSSPTGAAYTPTVIAVEDGEGGDDPVDEEDHVEDKLYTVDEIIAAMSNYKTSQISKVQCTVTGVATSSSFNSNYSSYTIWLQSDDGSKAQAFQLYSVGMDAGITGDYSAADALKGKTITCRGYVELYNGKYEMPYLNATLSPTGSAFTPTITEVK